MRHQRRPERTHHLTHPARSCDEREPERALVALLAVGGALLFAGVFVPINAPFDGGGTAFYATISKNILRSGDWLTLRHAGWPIFDKPPLTFWMMALSFAAFGTSEPVLMAWHTVCAALTVLVTFALARLALPRRQALLAALALLVSTMFFYSSLIPQQDIPLTLFITLSIYWQLRWERDGHAYEAVASWLSAALAVLTKGIVGAAFPAAIVVLHLLIDRPRMPPRALRSAAAGLLAFLAVAAPWFVVGYLRQGQPFMDTFFLNGNLGVARFFHLVQNRSYSLTAVPQWAGFVANVPLLFYGTLPWVGWVWPAVSAGWKTRRDGVSPVWVCTLWVLVVFGVLSISLSDRALRYLLPLAPPLAVLAGRVMGEKRFEAQTARVSLLAAAALLAVAIIVPRLPLPRFDAPYWADASYINYLPLLDGFAVLTAAGLCAYAAAVSLGRGWAGLLVLLATMLVTHSFVMGWLTLSWDRLSPWRPLARVVNAIPGAPDRVLVIDAAALGGHSDFADFDINRPVEFVNRERLIQAWEHRPVLAIVTPEILHDLPSHPGPTIIKTIPSGLSVVTNVPRRWSGGRP